MAKKNSIGERLAKLSASRDEAEQMNVATKQTRRDALGRLLAENDDPDMAKKIRRQLRRLGHYISKKGKPWLANAKRERKVKANASDNANVTPVDVNANATA